MNDDWEQFPPIEGDNKSLSGAVVLFVAVVFVVGMIVYVLL
jgi:hypothetical protein